MIPDYLVLGHLTRDQQAHGERTPGGTALYAAMTAARLGLRAAAFTATAPSAEEADWPFSLVRTPSESSSIFENRYSDGRRQQWLHAIAAPLDMVWLPPAWEAAPLVHLGPVLHECHLDMLAAFPAARICVTPQGWMRRWHTPLPAVITRARWLPDPALLRRIDLLVMSVEDVEDDEALVAEYARACRVVVLTRGAAGLTLYVDAVPTYVPAAAAAERDPTGAGDVFAAAMLIRLDETDDPLAAARFAAQVAAVSVEGHGISRIPTRAEVLGRGNPS